LRGCVMLVRYDNLKDQLTTEKARLEAEINEKAENPVTNVGYGNHMADDATYAYEQTKSLAIHQNTKSLLFQVNEALQRFENGTYGVCVDCGQSIESARLKAIPYTALCMDCAQARKNPR